MPKFLIEREMPGAGQLGRDKLQKAAQHSCDVLRSMGPDIQWQESFVTDDAIYCVYIAPSEARIREHAEKSGFPANKIRAIRQVVDPTTSEAA